MIADRSRVSTYLPEKDAKARTVTCAVLPEGAHYSSETRKRRFVSECVVGPEGLELSARHAVLSNLSQ
jgi:hypothetical protein